MVRGRPGWFAVLAAAGIVAVVAVVAAYPVWRADQPVLLVGAAGVGAVLGGFAPGVVSWLLQWSKLRGQRANAVADLQVARLGSVAGLLSPSAEVVRFAGRIPQLTALQQWCQEEMASVVRLLVAPGGFGKTRLAAEFASRMAKVGWECWTVAYGREEDAARQIADGVRGRLLVVVDYADARKASALTRLLVTAYRSTGWVRVLLLARTAGSWWRYLSAGSKDQPALIDSMTVPGNAIELPARADDTALPAVLAGAARDFARRLGRQVPRVLPSPPVGEVSLLRLHARALVAVLGDAATGDAIFDDVLRHEARYWRWQAQQAGLVLPADPGRAEALMRQVVAVAVLCGAGTPEQVDALIRRVPGFGKVSDEEISMWSGWLRRLYPIDSGATTTTLGVLQPDLVAETLAVEELTGWTRAQRQSIFRDLALSQAIQVLTVLGRAAEHHEVDALVEDVLAADLPTMTAAAIATARQFPGRFVRLLTQLLAGSPNALTIDQCKQLVRQVPYPSLELHNLAVTLTERVVSQSNQETNSSDRAEWLTLHAVRLAEVGRRAEGLAATEEAVRLYRELVKVEVPPLSRRVGYLAVADAGSTVSCWRWLLLEVRQAASYSAGLRSPRRF